MASISKDKSGNRTVQFVGPDKKRRSVRLGKIDADSAKKIAKHIEHLAQCWKYGSPPCPQTFDWVMGLLADPATHWLYDRLAAVKLVAERERPEDQVGELTRLGGVPGSVHRWANGPETPNDPVTDPGEGATGRVLWRR